MTKAVNPLKTHEKIILTVIALTILWSLAALCHTTWRHLADQQRCVLMDKQPPTRIIPSEDR